MLNHQNMRFKKAHNQPEPPWKKEEKKGTKLLSHYLFYAGACTIKGTWTMAYLLPDVSCILMCCLKQQQLPCNYPKQGVVNLLRHMLCFAETNGNCHAIISWLNVWSTRTLMKTPLCVGMRRYINDDRTKHCFIIIQNNI